MLKSKLFIVFAILIGFAVTGFQCSSTEITSAKLYIQQKNFEKAKEVLLKEIENNPNSAEGYYYLGVVHGELGEIEKAVAAFENSLNISNEFKNEIDKNKNYLWANAFNKGVSLYQRGVNSENEDSSMIYFEKSIIKFEDAADLQPDSADTYKNLAFVYINAEQIDKAINPLKKHIELTNDADSYKYLGEILFNKGIEWQNKFARSGETQDSVEAIQYFNEAIQILEEGLDNHPNNGDILLLLSNSYIEAGKEDVAMDAFRTGVVNEPENQFYRYNYGVLLLEAEEYAKAEEQFLKAIEIDPEYTNALYNLAVTYVTWGTHMRKVAEEEEDYENTEYLEKYQKAKDYLEKVVDIQPDDAATWELLGKVYAVIGMEEEANDAFEKADQLRGN